MKTSINIKIGGEAGEGIKSVGLILSKTLMRAGYYTFDYTEYPSLIRGGHNTHQSMFGLQPVQAQRRAIDILIALNQETVSLHQAELTAESIILYDNSKFTLDKMTGLKGRYLSMPMVDLVLKTGGKPVMANNAALGAVMYLTLGKVDILKGVISGVFSDKPEDIIKQNQNAAQAGFDYAAQHFGQYSMLLQKPASIEPKILLSGNEATALGAISAGMKFYSAYPMTPTSSILTYLAAVERKAGLVVKHAEDEISVINMASGASFAGVRTMVATSGGGFCLMTEGLGMAGMMELPLVIVEGMRSGPSSGMPTWHDQGDLQFVIHASHGEFPKIVLAPADIQDCFELTRQAFYFAEKYQTPVIILTDKYIAESSASVKTFISEWTNNRYSFWQTDESAAKVPFKRYQDTGDGISLRSLPGQTNGTYLSNAYEHDEEGFTTEEILIRNKMVEKRLKKFSSIASETNKLKQFMVDDPASTVALLSWGSNKGPVLEALKVLQSNGVHVSLLNLNLLWPFPSRQVIDFLRNKKTIIDLECNATAQLSNLVREQTGIEIKNKLLKYDGRPFYPEEIVNKIAKLA